MIEGCSGGLNIEQAPLSTFRKNQQDLIKTFYQLLNNKKQFDRQVSVQKHVFKAAQEMRHEETYTPKLAPKTDKF